MAILNCCSVHCEFFDYSKIRYLLRQILSQKTLIKIKVNNHMQTNTYKFTISYIKTISYLNVFSMLQLI